MEPGPGQVVDIASPALRAAIEAIGATAVLLWRVPDRVEAIRDALRRGTEADLVVSVGGVSMGERDLVRPVVEEMGELDFWRVKVRPGKPLAVGSVRGKPFVGLPGNPVSALVGFEVFVLGAVLAMSGREGWGRPTRRGRLTEPLQTPPGLRTFARARVVGSDGTTLLVEPVPGQGSYQVRWLGVADVLLDVPEDVADLDAGDEVGAIMVNLPPAPWMLGRAD